MVLVCSSVCCCWLISLYKVDWSKLQHFFRKIVLQQEKLHVLFPHEVHDFFLEKCSFWGQSLFIDTFLGLIAKYWMAMGWLTDPLFHYHLKFFCFAANCGKTCPMLFLPIILELKPGLCVWCFTPVLFSFMCMKMRPFAFGRGKRQIFYMNLESILGWMNHFLTDWILLMLWKMFTTMRFMKEWTQWSKRLHTQQNIFVNRNFNLNLIYLGC